MKRYFQSYWLFRLLFFGCVALSVGLVLFTVSIRQRGPARAETPRNRVAAVTRPREVTPDRSLLGTSEGTTALTSRVRITTVVPFRREIHVHNFGDAAEDLSVWRLVSPRPGGEDGYTVPVGTVLLPGQSLIVVVEEGVDLPGELHWRVAGDQRVLELTGDTVALLDDTGTEVSRFTYIRR